MGVGRSLCSSTTSDRGRLAGRVGRPAALAALASDRPRRRPGPGLTATAGQLTTISRRLRRRSGHRGRPQRQFAILRCATTRDHDRLRWTGHTWDLRRSAQPNRRDRLLIDLRRRQHPHPQQHDGRSPDNCADTSTPLPATTCIRSDQPVHLGGTGGNHQKGPTRQVPGGPSGAGGRTSRPTARTSPPSSLKVKDTDLAAARPAPTPRPPRRAQRTTRPRRGRSAGEQANHRPVRQGPIAATDLLTASPVQRPRPGEALTDQPAALAGGLDLIANLLGVDTAAELPPPGALGLSQPRVGHSLPIQALSGSDRSNWPQTIGAATRPAPPHHRRLRRPPGSCAHRPRRGDQASWIRSPWWRSLREKPSAPEAVTAEHVGGRWVVDVTSG